MVKDTLQAENIICEEYVTSPGLYWSVNSSSANRKFKLWMWDQKMLRAEFVTAKSEASRSYGNVMSKWPDDAMKNIAQLSLGVIKKGKKTKQFESDVFKEMLFTQELAYFRDCQYAVTRLDLMKITTNTARGYNWALFVMNESREYFAIDLHGEFNITSKSFAAGLFELYWLPLESLPQVKFGTGGSWEDILKTFFGVPALTRANAPLIRSILSSRCLCLLVYLIFFFLCLFPHVEIYAFRKKKYCCIFPHVEIYMMLCCLSTFV